MWAHTVLGTLPRNMIGTNIVSATVGGYRDRGGAGTPGLPTRPLSPWSPFSPKFPGSPGMPCVPIQPGSPISPEIEEFWFADSLQFLKLRV